MLAFMAPGEATWNTDPKSLDKHEETALTRRQRAQEDLRVALHLRHRVPLTAQELSDKKAKFLGRQKKRKDRLAAGAEDSEDSGSSSSSTSSNELDLIEALPDSICQLPAPDCRGHCRTSSASSRSQWAPDFNRELQIPVGTAGLQPRAPDPSGHCRTSVGTARSQWALPDFNRELQILVGTAGLQSRLPDPSGHCRTSTAR
eukprot:s791_g9.t1